MKLDAAKQAALDLHNQARREAPGAPRPDLTWDDSLANEAEAWALHLALTGTFAHAPQRDHGENLAYFEPAGERNLVAATAAWIAEKKNYHGQPVSGERIDDEEKMVGHYTAIIWPETTRVGMGFFDVPDDGEWPTPGRTYVVARYDVMQTRGQTAWRVSARNPYGYSAEGWKEEVWILRYGEGRLLL